MVHWYVVPTLPDFLLDFTLAQEEPTERFTEFWQRWSQFVAALWTPDSDATYAVDLRWWASRHRVYTSFGVRDGAQSTAASERARLLAAGLRPFGIGGQWLKPSAGAAWSALPGPMTAGSAYEVRQQEVLTPIRARVVPLIRLPESAYAGQGGGAAQGDRNVINLLPWWGPGSSMLLPYNVLTAQDANDVIVRIVLQPTRLRADEQCFLADVARQAESLAQHQLPESRHGDLVIQTSQNLTDPQLRSMARSFAANLRRLTYPFLCTMYVFSADPATAAQVANAMAAGIREEKAFAPPLGESEHLPGGAEVLALQGPSLEAAAHMAQRLEPAGFDLADTSRYRSSTNKQLGRLRYLMDARGAACAFRLPVAVRGGVPGFVVKQVAPEFHPGPLDEHRAALELGNLVRAGDPVAVPKDDMAKHCLITGFTGSGKTVTMLQLLHQLWVDHGVPFLVLESAKQEYRGLLKVEEMTRRTPGIRAYTLGNDRCAPIRLNPFQVLPGVRVEAHMARLQTCLEASMPESGPSSSVIAEALVTAYRNAGWEMSDVYPDNRSQFLPSRPFPTLTEFIDVVTRVIARRKYQGDVLHNVTAAIVGRLRPLTLGSKGRMFTTQTMQPAPDVLFQAPVILEMNDLNLDDKALVTMFLLSFLREYREAHKAPAGSLGHVTVVEEAHNILEDVQSKGGGESPGADTRYKAVQAFCALLTEIRSLGEGLIIADQSPEKLAPDAMRNTNLQIAHQLRDSRDREAVARAMTMDEEQRDYLGKLAPGQAAVFFTGLEKATFIQVPPYYPRGDEPGQFRGRGFDRALSDPALASHMDLLDSELADRRMTFPYPPCRGCAVRASCPHRDALYPVTRDFRLTDAFYQAYKLHRGAGQKEHGATWDDFYSGTAAASATAAERAGLAGSRDAGWCYFVQRFWAHWSEEYSYTPTADWRKARESFDKAWDALPANRSEP
ncbi:MAG: DUF87 domain-containing protein [Armatimonadetes bacterium]|nr:DUF87 domain-containing protein [Armatimonadota bacterium]